MIKLWNFKFAFLKIIGVALLGHSYRSSYNISKDSEFITEFKNILYFLFLDPKKPKVKKVQTKDVINISKVEPEASTTVTDKLSPISVTSTKRSLPVILPKPIINRKHCKYYIYILS